MGSGGGEGQGAGMERPRRGPAHGPRVRPAGGSRPGCKAADGGMSLERRRAADLEVVQTEMLASGPGYPTEVI
jgi:hypothetical protein